MEIQGRSLLVLGGAGLVGTAICRQLLARRPASLHIHSLRREEAEEARDKLLPEAGDVELDTCFGDIFTQTGERDPLERLAGTLRALDDERLHSFALHQLLARLRPDVVIDCVNTATGIAYRDIYTQADEVLRELEEGRLSEASTRSLLDALYVPRLIRHVQVLYRGMIDAGTRVYVKVGTTGTGGMGLNIPYTHSEERPSRTLLSKSALAGAQTMLLFLMARTPGAPITKEIKPAAAIGWKRIGYGPIVRRGQPLRWVKARPRPLGDHFSSRDPAAAELTDRVMENVFIDTGENGLFSLEEFSALTTGEQMELVTPEEIATQLLFEVEGGNTGLDVIGALDNATMGPSYRAGLMRHWALEKMVELEETHGASSIAFEMLGPPRLSKLLFEAWLLREAFGTITAVRQHTAEEITHTLNQLVVDRPELAEHIASVGLPVLMDDGRVIRGPEVLIPARSEQVPVTAERLEAWTYQGWVDLRADNCARWLARMDLIHTQIGALPADDTSSRFLRTARFWHGEHRILPGKLAGWIFTEEEAGGRMK